MPVSQGEQISRLEQEVDQVEHVGHIAGRILAELMKSSPPPLEVGQVRGLLRSARDLIKHDEIDTSNALIRQAEEGLESARHWLAVADLAISPFLLRTFFESSPGMGESQQALVRYFLQKQPRAENDRDKLDYLLSAYFTTPETDPVEPRFSSREELEQQIEDFVADLPPTELSAPAEMMLHELESLTARLDDFTDFDLLVEARLVERARALKISLGEDFYHPRLLPTIIRFNLAFRRQFDELFGDQLARVRETTRQAIETAWELVQEIEIHYEALVGGSRVADLIPEPPPAAELTAVGQPLEALEERLPIDRLMRRGEELQKEKELLGIITRLSRFVQGLSKKPIQAHAVPFSLRHAQIELSPWELEVFDPGVSERAPESTHLIQYALGVIAWLEEELALFRQTSDDRYSWKPHFDYLSTAVARAVELLRSMLKVLREDAPEAEALWFGHLLRSALRVGLTLNRVAPVFAEPFRT